MKPHLVDYSYKNEEKYAGVRSIFAIEDNSLESPICCCMACIDAVINSEPGDDVPGKDYMSFMVILSTYLERFDQEPHFKLAKSLFDDCLKSTVARSE